MLTTPNHTVSGNPIRFQNGAMRIQLDEEWKSNIGWLDRQVVNLLTWPFLLRYGYLNDKRDD